MDSINRLTRLNIEIEGLLRVLAQRDSADIRSLLAEKYEAYSQLFSEILSEPQPDEARLENATAALAETLTIDEVKTQEAIEEELPSENELAAIALDNTEEDKEQNEAFAIEDNIPAEPEEVENVIVLDEDTMVMPEDEDAMEPIAEPTEENAPEESVEPESEVLASAAEPEPEPEAAPAPKATIEDKYAMADSFPTVGDDIRVDEALSRREARDLKRAFTLNDKFRFRRGLFGNNDTLFADTLNTLMAMKSLAEAEEYLYGDMNWNPEDEDVKDFVSIVKNHFAGLA